MSGPNSLADPGQRFLARLIDGGVILGAWIVLLIVFTILGAVADQAGASALGGLFAFSGFMILLVATLGYGVYFVATRGQTPGKQAMAIRVVRSADGQIPGWGPAFLRWVIPAVMSIVPFLPLLDVLWLLWDENRQCLHDKAANTLVVRTR